MLQYASSHWGDCITHLKSKPQISKCSPDMFLSMQTVIGNEGMINLNWGLLLGTHVGLGLGMGLFNMGRGGGGGGVWGTGEQKVMQRDGPRRFGGCNCWQHASSG